MTAKQMGSLRQSQSAFFGVMESFACPSLMETLRSTFELLYCSSTFFLYWSMVFFKASTVMPSTGSLHCLLASMYFAYISDTPLSFSSFGLAWAGAFALGAGLWAGFAAPLDTGPSGATSAFLT